MQLSVTIFLLGLFTVASAVKHHLFVGTFTGPYLYALEFDDDDLTLTLTANISTPTWHQWIALSHNKTALYGVGPGSWYSYTVDNATSLTTSGTVSVVGDCPNPRPGSWGGGNGGAGFPGVETNGTSPPQGMFLTAATIPPYNVYGTTSSCGNIINVDANTGALTAVAQNISYWDGSGMQGMTISPDGRFLYAVDALTNSMWTYAVDHTTGKLYLLGVVDGPTARSNPRHAAVHPNGRYLYVLLEETNELTQYDIDSEGMTGLPVWGNVTYPLIKPGLNSSLYWSDEVMISPSAKYLWATSRAHRAGTPGYISAFSISPTTGSIEEQLFLTETTTSGGAANAVAPAPFSDEFVALTDTEKGFVQIWQLNTCDDGASAEVVADISLPGGGCCANAVWYD